MPVKRGHALSGGVWTVCGESKSRRQALHSEMRAKQAVALSYSGWILLPHRFRCSGSLRGLQALPLQQAPVDAPRCSTGDTLEAQRMGRNLRRYPLGPGQYVAYFYFRSWCDFQTQKQTRIFTKSFRLTLVRSEKKTFVQCRCSWCFSGTHT